MAEINSTTGHENEVIDVKGLKASLQKLKTDHIDTKANTNSLGTAATKNVPASGNAGDTEVVMGNDTRLSDKRQASDVYEWAKAEIKPTYTASEVGAIPAGEKGVVNGVASLDDSGKVPQSQLPSYVDDVLEYDNRDSFPETGESGKIYVDKSNNTSWRWSGSIYTQIKGDLAIGTTSGTAADGGIANTHYNNTSNPHGVTKAQVGLGDVGNFKAVSTVASQELTDAEKSNARTNIGLGTLATKSSLTADDIPSITKSKISDFPQSMPASDVYEWAKASTKPTYIANEVMSISVVDVTGNTSSTCSITGSGNAGKAQTIIYKNNGSADYTVTVPTTYKTPDGAAIELTCPVGGYCEVSYLNISGTIYARGL